MSTAPSCPNCGRNQDMQNAVNTKKPPKEGSISVCIYCGQINRFNADMSLRIMSGKELQEMKRDAPEFYQQLLTIAHSLRDSINKN